MADSHHFDKKIEKSPYVSNSLTDHHEISEPYLQLKIPVFLSSQVADGCHFEKPLSHLISATVRGIIVKFGMVMHFEPLKPNASQTFELL